MASNKPPSAADQQLIEHAARHGFTITVKQLAIWRRAGLLPGNIPNRSLRLKGYQVYRFGGHELGLSAAPAMLHNFFGQLVEHQH
ncbi:hypothetical protein [Streptomyces sp. NPDC051554]|uniref:hypothetical protein n=1 Tax=Streptomyces sp. NPDC051554 TaxID=3365656 RepID=UPI0037A245FE